MAGSSPAMTSEKFGRAVRHINIDQSHRRGGLDARFRGHDDL
jgi:hypothetical protein